MLFWLSKKSGIVNYTLIFFSEKEKFFFFSRKEGKSFLV